MPDFLVQAIFNHGLEGSIEDLEYPHDEDLPNGEHELVHVERIARDPENPRDEEPLTRTIRSIKNEGLLNPLTGRIQNDEAVLITNGWQRAQACAIELGWSHLPVDIKDSKFEALNAAAREGDRVGRELTRFQERKQWVSLFNAVREERGMSYVDAVDYLNRERGLKKRTLRRWLSIFTLPDGVLALVKEKDERTEMEWELLEQHDPNIRMKDVKLRAHVAKTLSDYVDDVADSRLYEVAVNVVDIEEAEGAIEVAKKACEHPEKSVKGIMAEYISSDEDTTIRKNLVLDPEVDEIFMNWAMKRQTKVNNIYKEALEEKAKEYKRKLEKAQETDTSIGEYE